MPASHPGRACGRDPARQRQTNVPPCEGRFDCHHPVIFTAITFFALEHAASGGGGGGDNDNDTFCSRLRAGAGEAVVPNCNTAFRSDLCFSLRCTSWNEQCNGDGVPARDAYDLFHVDCFLARWQGPGWKSDRYHESLPGVKVGFVEEGGANISASRSEGQVMAERSSRSLSRSCGVWSCGGWRVRG